MPNDMIDDEVQEMSAEEPDEKALKKAEKAAKKAAEASKKAEKEAPEPKAVVASVKRKPHWPEGFVPTGNPVEDTKTLLEMGPKTTFMIPQAPGDEPGAVETVQINGYKLTIKKGHVVQIPVAMAQLLSNKYNIEMQVASASIASKSSEVRKALE